MNTAAATTATVLYVQPMTGMVHMNGTCSTGTARYRAIIADMPTAELDAMVTAGRVKGCKTCYVAPANRA